jgi:hypothetical protein
MILLLALILKNSGLKMKTVLKKDTLTILAMKIRSKSNFIRRFCSSLKQVSLKSEQQVPLNEVLSH